MAQDQYQYYDSQPSRTPTRKSFSRFFSRTSSTSSALSVTQRSPPVPVVFPSLGPDDSEDYFDQHGSDRPTKRSFRVISRPKSSGYLKSVPTTTSVIPPTPPLPPPPLTLSIPLHHEIAPSRPLPDLPAATPVSPYSSNGHLNTELYPRTTPTSWDGRISNDRKANRDSLAPLDMTSVNLTRSNTAKSNASTWEQLPSAINSAVDVAFRAAHTSVQLSKRQAMFDHFVGSSTDAFSKLNTFYASNVDVITSATTNLASSNTQFAQFEDAVSSFGNVASVLVQGLDALAGVHPFVGIAVQAFKLVIQFDLQRRDNNKKVFVVKLQMQDMVCILFELRTIRDPKNKGPDGQTLEGRMQSLIKKIADAITKAGNAIDVYLGKSLLSKTIKSSKYKGMLTDMAGQFEGFKRDIKFALQMHTAQGVDKANEKLDDQKKHIKDLEAKLDLMLEKMDVPRERDMKKFIRSKNGAKAVIEDRNSLKILVKKSGEGLSAATGGQLTKGEKDNWDEAKKNLMNDFQEGIHSELERNFGRFEGKLILLEQRLTGTIEDSRDKVIAAVQDGAHKDIDNEDLRAIWQQMGWKGTSVKARHFILALHDYFSGKIADEAQIAQASSQTGHGEEASDDSGSHMDAESHDELDQDEREEENHEESEVPSLNFNDPEEARRLNSWALSFLNVSHVQSILEAIDDDATGFISVREVNEFAKNRPKGWSLPFWIAYWGTGWHVATTIYRGKIYGVLREIFQLIPKTLPTNHYAAQDYGYYYALARLERLLRSTQPAQPSTIANDPTLKAMVETYMKQEQARVQKSLEVLKYNLDSESTVKLICGPHRVERWIFPLLYLMLNHHLKLLKLACKYRLQQDETNAKHELYSAMDSLTTLDDIVINRIDSLKAIFKQTHSDVLGRFGNFAFGMFHGLAENASQEFGSDSIILSFSYEDPFGEAADSDYESSSDSDSENDSENSEGHIKDFAALPAGEDANEPALEILQWPPASVFPTYEDDAWTSSSKMDNIICGPWTGHFLRATSEDEHDTVQGPLQILLRPADQQQMYAGEALSHSGFLDVDFKADGTTTLTSIGIEFTASCVSDDHEYTITAVGTLDLTREVMSGTWTAEHSSSLAKAEHEGFYSYSGLDDDDNDAESDASDQDGDASADQDGDASADQDGDASAEQDDDADWESEVSSNKESIPAPGQAFYFTRTQGSLMKYRYSTKEFNSNPSRARWRFACEAVLHQVRETQVSWNRIRDRGRTRRRFIDLTSKTLLHVREPLPDNEGPPQSELDEIKNVLTDLSPLDGRLYVLLAEDELKKHTIYGGIMWCCQCEDYILRQRFTCIECVDERFSDAMDFCVQCLGTPSKGWGFVHESQHTIALIHTPCFSSFYLKKPIVKSRTVAQNVRADIKKRRLFHTPDTTQEILDLTAGPPCAVCEEKVSVPFWYCGECADAYTCDSCFLEDGIDHEPKHVVVRIAEVSLEGDLSVEDRVASLESKMITRLSTLESRVDEMHSMLTLISQKLVSR